MSPAHTNSTTSESQSSGMAFVVGAFFSARVILVLCCVRVLGTDPRTGATASLALNLLLLVLVCFHSLGAPRRSFGSMLQLPPIRWVLAFLVFSCASLAWSSTVSLPSAVAYWSALAADVLMVAILLRAGPTEAVASSLMRGFIWTTCVLAAIAWIMPVQTDLRLGDEQFFNTNQIGFLCALAFYFAQYLMRSQQGRWRLVAFFLAVTLLRSLSKTTIAAFLLSQSVLVIQDKSMTRRTKLLLTCGAVLVILSFWGLIEAYYDVYTNAGNQSVTLTGRIGIWAYVYDAAVEQPWIGHGFNSVWKVVPAFGVFEARHAENELLQQFYAYGAVGIALVIGLYGSLYRQFRSMQRSPLEIFFISFLLFIVIRGAAEAEPFDLLLPLWAIVLLSVVADLTQKQGQPSKAFVTAPRHTTDDSAVAIHPPRAWGNSLQHPSPQR